MPPKLFVEEIKVFAELGEAVNAVPRHMHYGGNLRYEIIPYSKKHNLIVKRRSLPPSSKKIHNENDSRKYIPFTGPLKSCENKLIAIKDDVVYQKFALKYQYEFHKGFSPHSSLIPDHIKDKIEDLLSGFKKILDNYYSDKVEIEFASLISIVACFLILVIMQILRMVSEWFLIA